MSDVKVLIEGHAYELLNREQCGPTLKQELVFQKRLTNAELLNLGLSEVEGVADNFQNVVLDGVFTQDVVKVLANRVYWQIENECNCFERKQILRHFIEVLNLYEIFQVRRQTEGVYHVKEENFEKGLGEDKPYFLSDLKRLGAL